MIIKEETSSLLVLEDKNNISFFIGGVFILVGAISFFYTGMNLPKWASVIFLVIGVIVILLKKSNLVRIDKSQNKLSFFSKGITGKNLRDYSIEEIKEVQLRKFLDTSVSISQEDQTMQNRYSYKLFFMLNDGQEIEINPRILSNNFAKEKEIGEKIAAFLNVPFIQV